MEDIKFVWQYGEQKPLSLSTSQIDEDVLRTRCGLAQKEQNERVHQK
jgi:hypothetical protein